MPEEGHTSLLPMLGWPRLAGWKTAAEEIAHLRTPIPLDPWLWITVPQPLQRPSVHPPACWGDLGLVRVNQEARKKTLDNDWLYADKEQWKTATLETQSTLLLSVPANARDQGFSELDTNLIKIIFSQIHSDASSVKNSRCKCSSGKYLKYWKKPAWQLTKFKKQESSDRWSKEWTQKYSCCVNDGSVRYENSELETQHHKSKSRIVLRGYIVENDSGSYAVFTKQFSSAFQLTAVKVMDRKSKLPRCSEKTADAVSAYTQVKMEDATSLLKMQSQNVQILAYVYRSTNGQNHCPVWKTPSFFSKTSVQSCFGRTILGKAIWEISVGTLLGKKLPSALVYLPPKQEDFSYLCIGTISNWQARQKT